MSQSRGRRSCETVLVALAAVVVFCMRQSSAANITCTVLGHNSGAWAVGDGQQVGAEQGAIVQAGFWQGTAASWTPLHPSWAWRSEANGVSNGQQAGTVVLENFMLCDELFCEEYELSHAVLWSGKASPFVDLHPSPQELSTSGVEGASSGEQVGWVAYKYHVGELSSLRAALWRGTPASYTDLHPAWTGAAYSVAKGAGNGQQVGWIWWLGSINAEGHAALWSGTAHSFIDLNPDSIATGSLAYGVSDGRQVGYAYIWGHKHAMMWEGRADRFIDLHPIGASESEAHGISGHKMAGLASFGDKTHAVMWTMTMGPAGNVAKVAMADLHRAFGSPSPYSVSGALGISTAGRKTYVVGYADYDAVLWTIDDTITVTRNIKSQIVRPNARYAGNEYWGHVTTYTGRIDFTDRNPGEGAAPPYDCWEAQDVVPAGHYFGIEQMKTFRLVTGEEERNSIYLPESPVPPRPATSQIFVHWGKGFDSGAAGHWTEGCVVFAEINEHLLVPKEGPPAAENVYAIDIVDAFPLSLSDYSISGTIFNQIRDLSRPGLEGVKLRVFKGGVEVASNTTGPSGHFWIQGLAPGEYRVEPELAGYAFEGLRLTPPPAKLAQYGSACLPWLSESYKDSHRINTAAASAPPDCYGVDFVGKRAVEFAFSTAPQARVTAAGEVRVFFTLVNKGVAQAQNVTVTAAGLGAAAPKLGVPNVIGTVDSGQMFSRAIVFPAGSAVVGALIQLRLDVKYVSGTTTLSKRLVVGNTGTF